MSAGGAVGIVVVGADFISFVDTMMADPTRGQQEKDALLQWHRDRINEQAGSVLGYVSTRDAGTNTLLPLAEIMNGKATGANDSVAAWYRWFDQQIDGVYFDQLVDPDVATSITDAQSLLTEFRTQHPRSASNARVMILAGQCPDEFVVNSTDIDWTLLWEDVMEPDAKHPRAAYQDNFNARVGSTSVAIPTWWKDPGYRGKIVHVVHNCPEDKRQHALGLANERNAGHVFVMDQRGGAGLNLYDHLPPYWNAEWREVDSYDDFGLDPLRALTAAGTYGASPTFLHAWPNFEAAWYGGTHYRGTFKIRAGSSAVARVPIPLSALTPAGLPPVPLFDIPAVWAAAHRYAQQQLGKETAMPVFGDAQGFALIVFDASVVTHHVVARAGTYQRPTFAEPGAVIRNCNRVIGGPSWCNFVPDNPASPQGVTADFNCYTLDAQYVEWEDVPTSEYIAQLS